MRASACPGPVRLHRDQGGACQVGRARGEAGDDEREEAGGGDQREPVVDRGVPGPPGVGVNLHAYRLPVALLLEHSFVQVSGT